MNKLLGTVLTSALTISLLAGCGTSTSNKKKVGIIQFMDHTSLNEIKDSFDKEMKTLGYDDKNIEYTFKNGQGDTNTCASIANDFAERILIVSWQLRLLQDRQSLNLLLRHQLYLVQ